MQVVRTWLPVRITVQSGNDSNNSNNSNNRNNSRVYVRRVLVGLGVSDG